ncbi:hypothetical protein SAMN04488040_3250 [Sulfitobacter marinus]|uniref:Glycosyltransferase, catalytic subunit of cellulose synthase and poly-beta-1,6-N-acetylglucosamine synthase n=1 Tax=Sulfitobacter marinus TaxID=394264 RepID=A0A1I6VDS6_9RHOB|nr:hypothetical protein [Sulfitobacter marinus]SFT11684.1 hypothetical protein SAMN04488040_3250 [Sulfitobacter marinus]
MTIRCAPLTPPVVRDDVLVSVCFGSLHPEPTTFKAVSRLAQELDQRFRFREIIVVADDAHRDAFLPLVHQVENIRLIVVPERTAFYQRRAIAADEAIGDVLLLTNSVEIAHLDVVAILERTADNQCAVLPIRKDARMSRTLVAPLVAIGRIAGFNIGTGGLQTLALPRTLLNRLLSHPDRDIVLRFLPRDVSIPICHFEVASGMPSVREAGQWKRRLALMQRLLAYLAPTLLMIVTLNSALLTILGIVYAIYVLGAWVVVDDLAAGWLTLSAMLSLTALFLGISITGLSLGLQQLLARRGRDEFDSVATEINRIDLFGQVSSELNVDLESGQTQPTDQARP